MPVRAALNVAYALLVDGLDHKQREDLDARIYGWSELNTQANRKLHDPLSGGED
jgi:ABC-type taurine transport system ATPase subunit